MPPPPLPTKPIGWVDGPDGEKYEILKMVWSSQGLVGRGTACYCVRDPNTNQVFAMKDYWVDKNQLDHESNILRRLDGIQGIPIVVKAWNVPFQGQPDSTLRIRAPYKNLRANIKRAIGKGRIHRRILMTPFATSILNFSSVEELISALCDIVHGESRLFLSVSWLTRT